MPIKWNTSKRDAAIIRKIVDRAVLAAFDAGIEYDRQSIDMDITAAHLNGNPLRLQELLDADDANFGHDVFGIRRFLNRSTGKLPDEFSPRFSAPVPVSRKAGQ